MSHFSTSLCIFGEKDYDSRNRSEGDKNGRTLREMECPLVFELDQKTEVDSSESDLWSRQSAVGGARVVLRL